ncbi:hypothetical protein M5J20_08010 [Corynebacterium sp. TA-R-1]|uniref:Uncharacterized protein n=1 Tax=Corynebacterium stercoris TaxID=2943490 RepID=A0ABT1G382_9CORY|nr:hypothetical protein [Corynebacterium stercoris]MCP1388130.1 hypothetical protein [Corynebacterium stercoris]
MSSPVLRRLTVADAQRELATLESQVDGPLEEFERRAHHYTLSPREQGIWERISELRWMLSNV